MRFLFVCLVAAALSMPGLAMGEHLPGGMGLPPEQAEAIQSIGRAVLQAKKSLKPDTEVQALRQSAEALKAVVDEAVAVALPTSSAQPAISGQVAATGAKTHGAHSQHIVESTEFRQRLERFHARQADAESQMPMDAKGQAALQKQPAYPVLLRLRHLRDELEQALAAPSEDRQTGLARLKRQLDANADTSRQPPPGGQPLGLTTLTRHHRNEQAKPAAPNP